MNSKVSRVFVAIMTLTTIDTQQCQEESCQALVPYEVNLSPLVRFREQTKNVEIGQYSVKIYQDWTNNGVAGVLWDSAVILSKYLLAENLLRGKKVLELGAGIGLPSILAVKENALEVVCTDIHSAIPLLKKNVYENIVSNSAIKVIPLDWKESVHNDEYDLIVGADLIYIEELFAALKATLIRLTKAKTTIYMASKIRYAKDRKFYMNLKDLFKVDKVKYDKDTDIQVFRISLV